MTANPSWSFCVDWQAATVRVAPGICPHSVRCF
jgi:hypothetical protein